MIKGVFLVIGLPNIPACLEEIVLGRVLEQVGLDAVCPDLDRQEYENNYIKPDSNLKLDTMRLQ